MATMDRRKFLSRAGQAGIGASAAAIVACGGSGGNGFRGASSAPVELLDPEANTFAVAGGDYQYSDFRLNFDVLNSTFPAACLPQASNSYEVIVRAITADAMYWAVVDGAGKKHLQQWHRFDHDGASDDIQGIWSNYLGYQLVLDGSGGFALNYAGQDCMDYGFLGGDVAFGSPFKQGVASGDPQANSLVIWTATTDYGAADLLWQVATEPSFENIVASGQVSTQAAEDYTAKLIVQGLAAHTAYFFRFIAANIRNSQGVAYRSLVGRAKTLPALSAEVDALQFGMVSCSSYVHGFFNAYRQLARHDDLDYVLHLGDYVYEYPGVDPNAEDPEDYADQAALDAGRVYKAHNQVEMVTLEQYRDRHQHYKEDIDLQLLHTRYAFIHTWDDHEFADNTWDDDGAGPGGGGVNHQPNEDGVWQSRKNQAVQAYNEWMPIQPILDLDAPVLYRSFSMGNLAELVVLDTRVEGRSIEPVIDVDDYDDPNRRMISNDQETWLKNKLTGAQFSGRRWKLVAQQVMMSHLQAPGIGGGNPAGEWGEVFNTDQWDGYNQNRQRIFDHIKGAAAGDELAIEDVVVLTGDIHTSWAMEMVQNPKQYLLGTQKYGVEFVVPSVTSPGLADVANVLGTLISTYNPHIQYANLAKRGYAVLRIDHSEAQASWYHVGSILDEENEAQNNAAVFKVASGSRDLQQVALNPAL